jgi:FtsZ-interacting cell division protein ZipA
MSDLLIILVVLGAFIVAGVVLFNWWQEKTFRSRIANDFKPSKRDVLIEDFQVNTENLGQERIKSAAKSKLEPRLDEFSERNIAQRKEPVFDEVDQQIESTTQSSYQQPVEDTNAISRLKIEDIATEDIEAFSSAGNHVQAAESIANLADTIETSVEPPIKQSSYVMDEVSIPAELHAQIDLIALLYAAIPIAQAKVVGLEAQFKEFPERTFAYGLTTQNEWISVRDSKRSHTFTQIAYSLQLADRGGAVNRATLNRFQHMVETIGLDLSAHVEWQGAGDPLNNAMTLDQFCIEVDKTVGFHLLANNGASFHATKLRGLAEAQGLSLGDDGRFHHNQAVPPHQLEFAVKNYEGNAFSPEMLKSSVMHGVTFQLDIPTVKNSAEVFDNMVQVAKSIAKSLDASIVDDNKKMLGDIHLEKIRQQLKVINATMIAKGIIPGSPHALRLFS